MSCPDVTPIKSTECIGNSLATINSNFVALKDAACDNYSTITTLNASILDLNTKVVSLSNQVSGVAKAWVKFDGTRDSEGNISTAATNRYIYSSYNVDYVYKATTTNTPATSAGDYRIYFKPGIVNTANYAVIGTSSEKKDATSYGWLQPYLFNPNFVGIRVHSPIWPGDAADPAHVSVVVFS